SAEGVERALVLMRDGEELRGSAAVGWEEVDMGSLVFRLDGSDPLAEAFHEHGPAEIPAIPPLDEAGPSTFTAITLYGPGAEEGPAFGILLLAGRAGAVDLSSDALATICSFAQIAYRIREREEL